MARPSKPVAVLETEKKSHRTKAELEHRKQSEAALLSGAPLYEREEVKKNKVAHNEFIRVCELMRSIGKDDALYSSGINTYCQLYAEISDLKEQKNKIIALAEDLKIKFDTIVVLEYDDILQFTKQITKLINMQLAISSEIDKKRRLMLAIDKENVMTISAALRSIPKTPEKAENPLIKALAFDEE
jgi:hypothetical protein